MDAIPVHTMYLFICNRTLGFRCLKDFLIIIQLHKVERRK